MDSSYSERSPGLNQFTGKGLVVLADNLRNLSLEEYLEKSFKLGNKHK